MHEPELKPHNTSPFGPKDEDPELFQAYLNCVYFGPETLEQWSDASEAGVEAKPEGNTRDEKQAVADLVFEKLVRLYLLAERLVDLKTANMAVGEIVRSSNCFGVIPTQGPVSLAYGSTATGSPLRRLLRDYWIFESVSVHDGSERLRTAGFPPEFVQDIAVEMLRIVGEDFNDFDKTVMDVCCEEVCRYHQHDELHPGCVPVESGMYLASSC